jgi:hypothetical protein
VGEEVGCEWLTGINDQYAVVLLGESLAPELCPKLKSLSLPMSKSAAPNRPLTWVSLASASRTGCVKFNIGTPWK